MYKTLFPHLLASSGLALAVVRQQAHHHVSDYHGCCLPAIIFGQLCKPQSEAQRDLLCGSVAETTVEDGTFCLHVLAFVFENIAQLLTGDACVATQGIDDLSASVIVLLVRCGAGPPTPQLRYVISIQNTNLRVLNSLLQLVKPVEDLGLSAPGE